jgi:hypothetical protein
MGSEVVRKDAASDRSPEAGAFVMTHLQGSRVSGITYKVTWANAINLPDTVQTRELEFIGVSSDGTLMFRHPERRSERVFIRPGYCKSMIPVSEEES